MSLRIFWRRFRLASLRRRARRPAHSPECRARRAATAFVLVASGLSLLGLLFVLRGEINEGLADTWGRLTRPPPCGENEMNYFSGRLP